MIKLGEVVSKVDQWIFYWKEKSKLKGITIFFFRLPNLERKKKLWGNNCQAEKTFQVGTENIKLFKYIGIHFDRNNNKLITVNQESYVKTINPNPLYKFQISNPHWPLTEEEMKSLRRPLKQRTWIAGKSKPEIRFWFVKLVPWLNQQQLQI